MVIFIDESGTHKQVDYATIALVYVEVSNLESFEKEIDAIEQELRIKYFHWTDEKWLTRKKFLSRLMKLDFTVKVAVLKNPVRVSKSLEDVLRHLVIEEDIQSIWIDGRKPKWYELRLKKILRDKGISVKKLRAVKRDESSPGIRVSDCLAGLVRYYYDHPDSHAKIWYNKLKKADKVKFELTAF